jgi:hypothetical protein
LDQYETQKMFSDPIPPPKEKYNGLHMLWDYKKKDDGTEKARCVCNGSPRSKGTVSIGHTYASSLEQPANRIFWAAAGIKGYIVVGAVVSNAFSEAPPPAAPLYLLVEKVFREWWTVHKGNAPIPTGWVLKVGKAIEGHPKSP